MYKVFLVCRSVQNYRQGRAPEGGKTFGEGYELLRVDGDKLHDVCVCNSGKVSFSRNHDIFASAMNEHGGKRHVVCCCDHI